MKIIRKTYIVQIQNNKSLVTIRLSGGTIKKIAELNIQYVEGYRLTDEYPHHYILKYPTGNFHIYANRNIFFFFY